MRRYINFLTHEQFGERLYIVNEGYSMVHRFTIGVITGDEKVLVIDTGLGMTDELRRYIESFVGTDRPIICACTAGTTDTVGSACQFDEAYCSKLDLGGEKDPCDPLQRYMDLADYSLESEIVMEYCRKHMIPDNHCEFKNVADGDVFDLGGVKIRAIAVPGPTPGSMVYYNEEEKYCFTGAAVNTDVRVTDLDIEGLRTYQAALKRLLSVIDPETTIYSLHIPLTMKTQIAQNLADCVDEILDGKVTQDPPAESVFHGKNNNKTVRGHYLNNTCLVYDRAKIGLGDVRMNPNDVCYYSHEKWTDRIYTLTINPSTVNRLNLMVFVGDEKILLIDSGHGIDDKLKDYVQSFAGNKPIILALTHIGIDHGGAAKLFDEVWMHENDIKKITMQLGKNRRLGDVQPFSNYNKEFEDYTINHIIDRIEPEQATPCEDGHIFHLGNLDVEAIFTPGHSTGHLAFYCASENICFTGDAMNVDTHLKGRFAPEDFMKYSDMLQNFMNRTRPDTLLFASHLNRPYSMRVPRNIQACCLELANLQTYGDAPGEAIQKHIDAFHNPYIREHYHGLCCIVYNTKDLGVHPQD